MHLVKLGRARSRGKRREEREKGKGRRLRDGARVGKAARKKKAPGQTRELCRGYMQFGKNDRGERNAVVENASNRSVFLRMEGPSTGSGITSPFKLFASFQTDARLSKRKGKKGGRKSVVARWNARYPRVDVPTLLFRG